MKNRSRQWLTSLGVLGIGLSVGIGGPANARPMITSVDTMHESRDKARDTWTQQRIDAEVAAIKNGANPDYITVDTPYDSEFDTRRLMWINSIRAAGKKVMFRGNFSAWEGWFGYTPGMTYATHKSNIDSFIRNHSGIFQDGDIFMSCPEPENGYTYGDPRNMSSTNKSAWLAFLREEFAVCQAAFHAIGKQVCCSYISVNGDVGKDVIDQATVNTIGGVVTIDHYATSASQMQSYVDTIHTSTGADVMIGEVGVTLQSPYDSTAKTDQTNLMNTIMSPLKDSTRSQYVRGINYWTSADSGENTQRIWAPSSDYLTYTSLPILSAVTSYFTFNPGVRTVYEAERSFFYGTGTFSTSWSGYNDRGFVDNLYSQNSGVEFCVYVSSTGSKTLTLRYANGTGSAKAMTLLVNGATSVSHRSFPATASWTAWSTVANTVTLNAGWNKINYKFLSGDTGNINIDRLTIS